MAAVSVRVGLIAGIVLATAWARAEEPSGALAAPPAAGAPAAPPPAGAPAPVNPIGSNAPVFADPFAPGPGPVRELAGPQTPPLAPQPTSARDALRIREPAAPAVKRRYLYQRWPFWAVAGGVVVGMIVLTYAVTRPPPQPYYGNTIPNFNVP